MGEYYVQEEESSWAKVQFLLIPPPVACGSALHIWGGACVPLLSSWSCRKPGLIWIHILYVFCAAAKWVWSWAVLADLWTDTVWQLMHFTFKACVLWMAWCRRVLCFPGECRQSGDTSSFPSPNHDIFRAEHRGFSKYGGCDFILVCAFYIPFSSPVVVTLSS